MIAPQAELAGPDEHAKERTTPEQADDARLQLKRYEIWQEQRQQYAVLCEGYAAQD